jgi:prepilin-type N-terminal cleavage/methylation domain-containing protein
MTSPTGEIIQPRAFARDGFSLIELILVLVLLTLLAGMSSPMLSRFARGRTTADAAGQLLAIMQYAQDQASLGAGPHRLNVDKDNNTYWLTAAPLGAWQKIGSEIGRTFHMPENVTLQLKGTQDLMTNGYIQFEADGSHDMAALILTDPQGHQIVIGCASPSEPYRIGDPAELQEATQ